MTLDLLWLLGWTAGQSSTAAPADAHFLLIGAGALLPLLVMLLG